MTISEIGKCSAILIEAWRKMVVENRMPKEAKVPFDFFDRLAKEIKKAINCDQSGNISGNFRWIGTCRYSFFGLVVTKHHGDSIRMIDQDGGEMLSAI